MFSLVPVLEFDDRELDKLLDGLMNAPSVESGVKVTGEAAAYALVWEFGNIRQHKKGPKTTLGINLETGDRAWLTIQAPLGYVRVNEPEFWALIKKNLGRVDLSGSQNEVSSELEDAAQKIAEGMAALVKDTAPVDTGDLRDSISAVEPGDPDLESGFETGIGSEGAL